MKKILIAVIIVLLIALAYFAIFEGIELNNFELLSVEQIAEKNNELTDEISEVISLQERDFPAKKDELSEAISGESGLLNEKQKYFELAKTSTENQILKASTKDAYLIEYLWARIGTHAKTQGVLLRMVFEATGVEELHNISFTVKGSYVNIIEFLYSIEDDDGLGFKIENYKMVSDAEGLTATFNVNNVRIQKEEANSSAQ